LKKLVGLQQGTLSDAAAAGNTGGQQQLANEQLPLQNSESGEVFYLQFLLTAPLKGFTGRNLSLQTIDR